MVDLDAKSLFNLSRFPSGVKLLVCLVYAPLGVCLAVVRFFICAQALIAFTVLHSSGTLRSAVVRVMSSVLGVFVRVDPNHPPGSQPRLLIANRVSCLDALAIQIATPCDSCCQPGTPSPVRQALRQHQLTSAEITQQLVGAEGNSLLLQPEGAETSGRTGLLKFSHQLVPRTAEVQPVALRTSRLPLADVSVNTLTSAAVSDLLYFLFVPGTLYTVSFLEPMRIEEDEEMADFVERVRHSIASHLKLVPTKYTAADKSELVKRAVFRPPPRPATARPPPELQRMAGQVKEVLPYVPLTAILSDLRKTRSVDQTIANILEGAVRYVPEPEPAASPAAPAPAPQSPAPAPAPSPAGTSSLFTGAPQFARSSQERHLSFQERKRRLIETARRSYIDKHGLKVPGYNC